MLDHEPIFGKNVIETLSEGMYDNPLFLYREYVQNSADAIDSAIRYSILHKDEGQIDISINTEKRIITFEDNGTGIAASEFKAMLTNIGDSIKDRKTDKGFRGIGRLGGLGYCQKIRFETSVKGEMIKSILEWDAQNLHDVLIDKNERIDAGLLIKRITNTWEEHCGIEEHFFKVSLINVTESHDDLLDVDDVRKYLSMVAPVPFDYERFRFVEDIENFLKANHVSVPHEYRLYLNGDEVRKGYETPIQIDGEKSISILDVSCHILQSDGKVIGWYWYCVSEFNGVLPKKCWQRGIRLRKANIQIGEADCLSNHPKRGQALWREDRGNNYFIGEIHVLDDDLIPNSRRDYFNQDDACRRFEMALHNEFLNLHDLYHAASTVRSAAEKIQIAVTAQKAFKLKEKSGSFYTKKEREQEQQKVEDAQKKALEAQRTIEKFKAKADATLPSGTNFAPLARVVEVYSKNVEFQMMGSQSASKNQPKLSFVKENLTKEEQRILNLVFKILEEKLPPDEVTHIREEILKRVASL